MAYKDTKLRIPFTVCYKDGSVRHGTMYAEGNIMMSNQELFARLDQLYTKETVAILFPPEPKPYQLSKKED